VRVDTRAGAQRSGISSPGIGKSADRHA